MGARPSTPLESHEKKWSCLQRASPAATCSSFSHRYFFPIQLRDSESYWYIYRSEVGGRVIVVMSSGSIATMTASLRPAMAYKFSSCSRRHLAVAYQALA